MAVTRACYGVIKVGSATVAEVKGWGADQQATEINTSVIGSCTESWEAGPVSETGTVDCFWDATDATGQELFVPGDTISLVVQPEGDTAGDVTYSGDIIVLGVAKAGTVGDIVSRTMNYRVKDGFLTEGTVSA